MVDAGVTWSGANASLEAITPASEANGIGGFFCDPATGGGVCRFGLAPPQSQASS